MERYPKTVGKFAKPVEFVAQRLGSKGVAELERVATALYVRKEMGTASASVRANRITELKQHISRPEAKAAVREVDKMFDDAGQFVGR
jgi:hypothetical protein